MKPYLIVGGGLPGLLTANVLKKHSIDFIGLEKSDRLGSGLDVGLNRFLSPRSTRYLETYIGSLDWKEVQGAPQERVKGKWREISNRYDEFEQHYLQTPYFIPNSQPFQILGDRLQETVKNYFLFHQDVLEVQPKTKKVICRGNKEYEYEKLIWCASLEGLAKTWKGEKKEISHLFKKKKRSLGGIHLRLEVTWTPSLEKLFQEVSTVIFPFRFKDQQLRTFASVSMTEQENTRYIDWILHLKTELLEDREEVAKCVRTMKRELYKEFSELKEFVSKEKFVFLAKLPNEQPCKSRMIEVLPNICYLGPEVWVADSPEDVWNMDRSFENGYQLDAYIGSLTDETQDTSSTSPLSPADS